MQKIKQDIISFIRDKIKDKMAIVGLSGGVDSSLVAYLAVEALGNEKVYGVIAPSASNTDDDLKMAMEVAKNLDIEHVIMPIEKITEVYQKQCACFRDRIILGNLKARIRMSLLYGQANVFGGIVLGTGNKTELLLGYFTKYGDGGVDLLPIGDLYKTQVWELARHIGVPKEIVNRKPSAGLWENQYDEEELGMKYSEIDKILVAIEKNEDLSCFDKNNVKRIQELLKLYEHKRKMPEICELHN